MGLKITKGLFTWREGVPANRCTRRGLTSHTFLSKTHQSVYMLDRVARPFYLLCLVAAQKIIWIKSVQPQQQTDESAGSVVDLDQ